MFGGTEICLLQNDTTESHIAVGGNFVITKDGVKKIPFEVSNVRSNGKRLCAMVKRIYKDEKDRVKGLGSSGTTDGQGNQISYQFVLNELDISSFAKKKMFNFSNDSFDVSSTHLGKFIGFLGNKVYFSGSVHQSPFSNPLVETLVDGNVKWRVNKTLPKTNTMQFILPFPGSTEMGIYQDPKIYVYDETKREINTENPIDFVDEDGKDVVFGRMSFGRKIEMIKCKDRVFFVHSSKLFEIYFKKEKSNTKKQKIEKHKIRRKLVKVKLFPFINANVQRIVSLGDMGLLISYYNGFKGLGRNVIYNLNEELIDMGLDFPISCICDSGKVYVYKGNNYAMSETKVFCIVDVNDFRKMKSHKIIDLYNPEELKNDLSWFAYSPLVLDGLDCIDPSSKKWECKAKKMYQVKDGCENMFKIFTGINCKGQKKLEHLLTQDYRELRNFGDFGSYIGAPMYYLRSYSKNRLEKGSIS